MNSRKAIKFIRIIFVLALMFLSSKPVEADWLGLPPGDHNVTLEDSSFSCGGSNCTGTVHIGSPGSTGFDWLFSIKSPFPTTFDCNTVFVPPNLGCFSSDTATVQSTYETDLVQNGLLEQLRFQYSKTTGSLIYTVTCVNEAGFLCPGFQDFVMATGIVTLTVLLDVRPGSAENPINPKSNGVIPVAILSTDSFDASSIDQTTLRFGPDRALAEGGGHLEDVNGDGLPDLLLHFRTQDSGIQCGDTSVSITGQTVNGISIQGSDTIRTVGCKGNAGKKGK